MVCDRNSCAVAAQVSAVAVLDDGAHRYLRELGKDTRVPLASMLPLSQREAGDKEATTKTSMIFVPLGAPSLALAERLEKINAGIRSAKHDMRKMSKDAAVIYALATFGLGELNEAAVAHRVTNPLANFVLSNVPGVPHSVYLGGARMNGLYLVSTMGAGIGLNVTLASYAGSMDWLRRQQRGAAQTGSLVGRCAAAYAELKAAADARGDTAGPPSAPRQIPAAKKSGVPRPAIPHWCARQRPRHRASR